MPCGRKLNCLRLEGHGSRLLGFALVAEEPMLIMSTGHCSELAFIPKVSSLEGVGGPCPSHFIEQETQVPRKLLRTSGVADREARASPCPRQWHGGSLDSQVSASKQSCTTFTFSRPGGQRSGFSHQIVIHQGLPEGPACEKQT